MNNLNRLLPKIFFSMKWPQDRTYMHHKFRICSLFYRNWYKGLCLYWAICWTCNVLGICICKCNCMNCFSNHILLHLFLTLLFWNEYIYIFQKSICLTENCCFHSLGYIKVNFFKKIFFEFFCWYLVRIKPYSQMQ